MGSILSCQSRELANMKVCLLVLTLVACCLANTDIEKLINKEVGEIMHSNPGISVDACSTKCDALFDLVAGHDERITDQACHDACDKAINHGGHHGGHHGGQH